MTNPRLTKKERALIKSAIRRVFSRSDLRRQAVALAEIKYTDPKRPRVTKWCLCTICKKPVPRYLMEVDHILPVCKITETMDEIGLEDLVNRVWCAIDNLQAVCKDDHRAKTLRENKERRDHKKKQIKKRRR